MKLKKVLITTAVLGLSIFALAGFGKKSSKELVLYTWEGMFPDDVIKDFEKQEDAKVIYSNFDSDETMLEKLTQAKGGDYDLVVADDYIVDKAIKDKLVKKLDKKKIKNIDEVDDYFKGQFYDKEDEYTVPYGGGIPLIVYNPKEVDFPITSYADLWNPKLKDSVALIANYRVLNGIALKTLGKSFNEENVDVLKEAGKKLEKLAPNVRLIQDDNTQNALLNGEAKVALLYTSQVTTALKEDKDLKVVYPKEGLGFGVLAMFVPEKAPNSELAYKFLNYLLEPDVAAKCTNYVGYYTANKGAKAKVDKTLVIPSDTPKGEIIQNVSKEAEEQLSKNFTEFKAHTN